MQSWLVRRRARIDRTDAVAEALIRDFSDEAYSGNWPLAPYGASMTLRRIAAALRLWSPSKWERRAGIDPSTRIAMNALFVPDREPTAARLPRMRP